MGGNRPPIHPSLKVGGEHLGGLISILWIRCHGLLRYGAQRPADWKRTGHQNRSLTRTKFIQGLIARKLGVGRPAGKNLKKNGPGGIDIDQRGDLIGVTACLLRRHVYRSSTNLTRLCLEELIAAGDLLSRKVGWA